MSVESTVKETIIKVLNVDASLVSGNITLEDLGADSLDKMELAMELEEVFDIEISEADLDTVKTVDDLITLIVSKEL
jgi:acyl carrier protein